MRWRLRRLPAAAGAVGPGLSAVGWVGAVGVRTGLVQSTVGGDELRLAGRARAELPNVQAKSARRQVAGLGRIMPMPRTDIPAGWDERTVLTTFLDYVRATVHAKCEDLAEADARRAPLPGSPLMTLAGLVNHLRWVEYFWFQVMLLGEDDHGPWTEEDPDREMRIAVEVLIAQLLDEYEAQCARYRDLVASLELDTGSDSLSWPHLGRFRP